VPIHAPVKACRSASSRHSHASRRTHAKPTAARHAPVAQSARNRHARGQTGVRAGSDPGGRVGRSTPARESPAHSCHPTRVRGST
jgi:hypothetical protein